MKRTVVIAMVVSAVALFAALLARQASPSRIIPNDPFFKYQVSLLNPGGKIPIERTSIKPSPVTLDAAAGIDPDITRAWTISTGSRKVVVAVLDDGFFYNHEDLAGNIWTNPGESGPDASGHAKETNGIDDDGNGYVDDVMGYDFAFDDPDPDCYVFDGMVKDRIQPYWHSISALGIIGARGNNGLGVAGVNWDVSMMLLKIGAQGIGRDEKDTARPGRAAKAIRYAADNGARVINWSGFVSDPTPEALAELKSALEYAGRKNVLLVVGAGNNGLDIDRPENFTYPACFPLDNILTVAMINFRGGLVRYQAGDRWLGSNYGPHQRRHRRHRREFYDRRYERPEHLPARRRHVVRRAGRYRDRRSDAFRQSRSERDGLKEAPHGHGDPPPRSRWESRVRRDGQRL